VSNSTSVLATDNLAVNSHPFWSQISIFDISGGSQKQYLSPELATIIPMLYTTVPTGATFTLESTTASNVIQLSYDGNQNKELGPGSDLCLLYSFFRLITSTCYSIGGSIGNPILIPAGLPVPIDIVLPTGFVPSQPFISLDGDSIPANQPLPKETTLPAGAVFNGPFVIPSGQPLRDGEDIDKSIVWVSPTIWNSLNPVITYPPPCSLIMPP
jgi:hypothetical protein